MKKLAILGASKPHLPLYLKAKSMGLETYCVAWAAGAYCKSYADHFCDISVTDKERVAELCRAERIDGIVANALEMTVPTLAYVHEQCGLNGNSMLAALRSTNKKEMRKRVKECNACPQPAFSIARRDTPIAVDRYPVVVKPTDCSASNGVTKVSAPAELPQALERAFSAAKSGEILIEECVEGREVSVESISFHGEHHVLTVTDKDTTGAPYFVETGQHQPSTLPQTVKDQLALYVKRVLDALEIHNSASHAEFKISSDGQIYFIEVGARGGGDFISYQLVELSTGYDYVKGMIEVAMNQFEPPKITRQSNAGVYFLSKETEQVRQFIEQNRQQPWVVDSHIDDTPLKSLKRSQDRTGYIIYQADHKILI